MDKIYHYQDGRRLDFQEDLAVRAESAAGTVAWLSVPKDGGVLFTPGHDAYLLVTTDRYFGHLAIEARPADDQHPAGTVINGRP
jgi:hypothetical protein